MASETRARCTQHPKWDPMGRIVIENIYPELNSGRYPVKRLVGDKVEIWADIFCDGHDALNAAVKYRHENEKTWRRAPMRFFDNDRWVGVFELKEVGRHLFTIEAWVDLFESWRQNFQKKREAGQDTSLELREGYEILEASLRAAPQDIAQSLRPELDQVHAVPERREELLLSDKIRALMADYGARANVTLYAHENAITADRRAGGYAAWYEMFARSQGTVPGKSASFDDCLRRLPEIRDMGFDVLYFVPIHPIGRINRKGRNNTLDVGPEDPGSPYAIGSDEGGHTAVHPELGTLDDFRRLIEACRAHGMEVALDYAIQCAPDHPWIREQANWFKFRPDGTIRYAENPPKKYQDIVNVDFYSSDREGLWNALRDVVLFWADQGVRIFRVDNPHTKPVPFWEWLIREVQCLYPDVIFLSEAFTRPKMLKVLAKAGFTQSYSYFTWRNFKHELIEYLTELTQSECREYLRPNFFTNTPDILPPILQRGGRPAFLMRLVLAATLSSVYGIYNGFELCENDAMPESEEYRNSEKYEYKVWDWNRPGNIKDYIARVNRARRENPALQQFLNLRFYPASSDSILFYGKRAAENMVFVAVNLDPFEAHESAIEFPLGDMEIGPDDAFEVEELLTGTRHLWTGAHQRIRLDPHANPAAIFRITPFRHVAYRQPQP